MCKRNDWFFNKTIIPLIDFYEQKVGNLLAEWSIEAGIKKVVFDKGEYSYHGRIKALADAARKSGLEF